MTVTGQVDGAHLKLVLGMVTRYVCPALKTVHFVVEKAARDSVTTSTFADTHGKSLSSALLELELDIPQALLEHIPQGAR